MSTRIRYTKSQTGYLVSKPFVAGLLNVVVNINPERNADGVFVSTIVTDDGVVVATLLDVTHHGIKKKSKVLLKNMGVVFSDEVRNGVDK